MEFMDHYIQQLFITDPKYFDLTPVESILYTFIAKAS